MGPRRTPTSNRVFLLEGGNEDNDLWVRTGVDSSGHATIASVWELTDEEREAIANGANIELMVWGLGTPPVSLAVTHERLGKDGHG